MRGKCAVITGSTSGIGRAIAESLASQGVNVMLNGFGDPAEIESIRAGIESTHAVKARYHSADMTKPAEICDLIAQAEKELGGLDILVNNAGIQHTAPVETFPADRWDAVIAVNLSSVFHATQAALPRMKARGWGRIINVASVHGLVASTHKAAYVAAKHGVVGLTKVVALETAEANITVNAICPGWVRTALVEKQIDDLAQKAGIAHSDAATRLLEEKQPSKKFVEVEQIGQLVVFLCSDTASGITGVALPVDGGWTAR